MKIAEYQDLFSKGIKNNTPITGLCGRIIRGKVPEDFQTLTDDPNRKIVMLMGGDGLEKLLGKTGYEALVSIGYLEDYIEYKVNSGFQFKLVVFKEGNMARLAIWDNIAELVSDIYPDVKDMIYAQLKELKNAKFSEIENEAGWNFSDVDRKGISDPKFTTHERFKQSAGTLIDVRSFLYHTLHLRELFSGDGYTYTEEGKRGLQEYIAPNCKLDELGEHCLADISIIIPK